RKNFRLLLDGEDTTALVSLPVARVRRDGAGHFVYDTDFIPPSLRVGASPALVALLTRLLEQLTQRAELLNGTAASQGDDLVDRWMAQAIHESLGPLLHFHRSRDAHPSELFQVLARLAGSLSTFSLTLHPRDLPTYDHGRPGEAFREVARRIRDVLALVAPSNTLVLPFRRAEESFRVATIGDARAFGRADWFLGVRSPSDAAELPTRVPRLLNLCSAKH